MGIALFIIAGFILLTTGGEVLVRGAVDLAKRLGVTPLVIGVVLVGFGTSLPELVTSVQAGFAGAPDIAIGNVIGSNIANVLLIMGVAAVMKPVAVPMTTVRKDGYLLLFLTLAATPLLLTGNVGRLAGAALVGILALYILFTLKSGKPDTNPHDAEHDAAIEGTPKSVPVSIAMAVGGILITIAGAKLLVSGAIDLARLFGISEAVIGLTIVAVGTSLPELVTSVIAARKGHSDVSLGNVLGSNVFNLFGILGIAALILPLKVSNEIMNRDVPLMLLVTFILVFLARKTGGLSRPVGFLFLAAYAAYSFMLYTQT